MVAKAPPHDVVPVGCNAPAFSTSTQKAREMTRVLTVVASGLSSDPRPAVTAVGRRTGAGIRWEGGAAEANAGICSVVDRIPDK